MFLHLSVSHSVHRGRAWQKGVCSGGHAWWGCAWWGACMTGGHAQQGRHAQQGGMHSRGMQGGGAMHSRGMCVVGGMQGRGGMHGGGGGCACHTCPPDTTRYGRSMRGRYASYWNAFLLTTLNLPSKSIERSPLSLITARSDNSNSD